MLMYFGYVVQQCKVQVSTRCSLAHDVLLTPSRRIHGDSNFFDIRISRISILTPTSVIGQLRYSLLSTEGLLPGK